MSVDKQEMGEQEGRSIRGKEPTDDYIHRLDLGHPGAKALHRARVVEQAQGRGISRPEKRPALLEAQSGG